MPEESRAALINLITAALAWHDVEFGMPGEFEAELELSAVLNTHRAELERMLAGAQAVSEKQEVG